MQSRFHPREVLRSAALRLGYKISRAPRLFGEDIYREFFPATSIDHKAFYNFGSGNWRHPLWTNVDYSSAWYSYEPGLIDINWDMVTGDPLPVESASAELCYSSHTVEHLLDDHVAHVFREMARILKPGGVARIATPNIRLYYEAYRRGDGYFSQHYGREEPFTRESLPLWLVSEFATQMVQPVNGHRARYQDRPEAVRAVFDSMPMEDALRTLADGIDFELQRTAVGNHVNWWTHDKLSAFLKAAGFSDVVFSGAGQSIVPVMRDGNYFDTVFPGLCVFVDAIR